MTTTTFPAEPGNNTFAVWFDANNDPYFTYYREDAHTNGYDHWFNADQHDTGDDDEPKTWAELCDEAYGMRGPVLLVPAAKVDELTAALAKSREQAATYANEIGSLTAENARVRQQRDGLLADLTDAGNEVDLLTAENTRLRQQRDELIEQLWAQKPVVEAAEAWAEMVEIGGDAPGDARKVEDALHDAIEQHRLMDLALTSARAEQPAVAR